MRSGSGNGASCEFSSGAAPACSCAFHCRWAQCQSTLPSAPLQPARHRVLPLNQICAGTLRALRLMMADVEGAAGVARAAPTTDAPALGPPGVVAVPSSAADDSFKPPVETVVQRSRAHDSTAC